MDFIAASLHSDFMSAPVYPCRSDAKSFKSTPFAMGMPLVCICSTSYLPSLSGTVFRKAATSSPCVVILDEIDSLAGIRQNEDGVSSSSAKPVLGQLLTEIEDVASSRVAVIGITNRPDMLDPAMLRSGRLDLSLYVAPPDEKGRLEIIKIITRNMPLADDVNFSEIAISTQNYTGADLASLCREAGILAMKSKSKSIRSTDFASALKKVNPSITPDVEKWYANIQKNISNAIPKPLDKPFYR